MNGICQALVMPRRGEWLQCGTLQSSLLCDALLCCRHDERSSARPCSLCHHASCLRDVVCCALLCPAVRHSDNTDLEAVLKETERQRREFAARYAFMTLDTDGDGYVSVEQVGPWEGFWAKCAPLSPWAGPGQSLPRLETQPSGINRLLVTAWDSSDLLPCL